MTHPNGERHIHPLPHSPNQRNSAGPTIPELLNALFEKLHVKDRQIMGYTPRGDRVGRVAILLGTARDYLDDSRGLLADPEAILYAEGEGPGAALSNRDVWRRGRDLNSRWASDP